MAKQTGLFRFTGKLDNVIGYRRNGKHYVRSMPETVRQTPATRQAARNFGVASRKGRLVRRAITPYLGRYDGTTVNRLNKALVQLPNQQLQGLEGFRFNRHTGLDKLLPLLPVISGDGLLKVPAQELPRFPRATHLEICLIAARLNFAERRIEDVQAVTEIIALKEDFMGLELELPHVAGKGTLVLTVQVQACDSTNGRIQPMHDRRFMAADIIAIIPPGRNGREQQCKKRAGRRNNPRNARYRAADCFIPPAPGEVHAGLPSLREAFPQRARGPGAISGITADQIE